jgi:hypothetical protein
MGIFSKLVSPVRKRMADAQFLAEIEHAKQKADKEVQSVTKNHEQELNARFSEDLELRQRLSQFAQAHELDKALIALWEEVRRYPEWAKSANFSMNKLGLTEASGSEEGKKQTVVFSCAGHRYAISSTSSLGFDGDSYVEFNLEEDGMEVFAVSCSEHYSEYGTSYKSLRVNAFKRRGEWAKTLLRFHGIIQQERNKAASAVKYYGADQIKKRFED